MLYILNMMTMKKEITYLVYISMIVFAIIGLQLTATGCTQKNQTNLYVSPGGNDAWTGTLPEPNSDHSDGPLATLNAARIKVREYTSGGHAGPVTVLIRGGKYVLDSTIVFGP